MQNYSIRAGEPDDLPFLKRMLYEAFSWRPGSPVMPFDIALADPAISRYVGNWARPGDAAVIAIDTAEDVPIGAAWYRLFPQDNSGYGYVDSETPELSIGVDPHYRGHGAGRALLEALLKRAHSDGFRALSLSVEPDNRIAAGLYERLGFRRVGTNGDSLTMLIDLTERLDG